MNVKLRVTAPTMTLRLSRRCLDTADAIILAVSPAPAEIFSSLAWHASNCLDCSRQLSTLQATIERMRVRSSAAAHLSELDVAELLDLPALSGTDDVRLAHLSVCTVCRSAFVHVRQLLRDPGVSRELKLIGRSRSGTPGSRRPPGQGWTIVAITAAAAIAISVATVRSDRPASDELGERWRALDETSSGVRLASAHDDAPPDTLHWAPVRNALRYRVVGFDAERRVAWTTEVPDTFVVLSESEKRGWGAGAVWRVRALTHVEGRRDAEYSGTRLPARMGK